MPTVFVVEDEPKLAALLRDYLCQSGFDVRVFDRGDGVEAEVRAEAPDLLLLDVMLPGVDGLELCKRLRRWTEIPIIMATARVEEIDRLLGLELGADDYICKPYSPREVIARVKAVLRRSGVRAGGSTEASRPALDPDRLSVSANGQTIELSAVEYRLLDALVSAHGRILSRAQLMDRMYSDQRVVSDRTVDSHVKKLRHRLSLLSDGQDWIRSVYGAGYAFEQERH